MDSRCVGLTSHCNEQVPSSYKDVSNMMLPLFLKNCLTQKLPLDSQSILHMGLQCFVTYRCSVCVVVC